MTKKAKRFQEGGTIPYAPIAPIPGQFGGTSNKNVPPIEEIGVTPLKNPGNASGSLRQIFEGAQNVKSALGTIGNIIGSEDSGGLDRGMNPFSAAYKKGGAVKSASKRADGIAKRGKTRGRVM